MCVVGWIEDNQLDLTLPPEFLLGCGRLGLPIVICTNDRSDPVQLWERSMGHGGQLGELEAALAADPANLELAWKYWHALGSWHGCDIRAGMYVFRAFRAAALQSTAGVLAFAQAYKQLFESSGERPRGLDAELASSARAALTMLPAHERVIVEWLLEMAAHSGFPES